MKPLTHSLTMKDLCSGFPLEPNWTITCSESDDPRSSVLKNKLNGISVFTVMVVFTPEQDNDKTNVEPVHSYDAFHTRHVGPGVKSIIGMHRFNICLVVVLLWCENTIRLAFLR